MNKIRISDVTMKQAAEGFSLSFKEKIELAKLLDKLGVDVIELEGVSGIPSVTAAPAPDYSGAYGYVLTTQPGVNSGENFKPYYKFYKAMDALRNPEKKVTKDNPHAALTEHIVDDEKRILVAVNCVPRESTVTLTMDGFKYSRTLKDQGIKLASDGNTVTLTMPGNTAIILEIAK